MNIHPIFVHFPVALLTIYSLLELVPNAWVKARPWFHLKAAFLATGVVSAVAAYLTGDMIEDQFESAVATAKLVETHSLFASITLGFFAVLAILYLAKLVKEDIPFTRPAWLNRGIDGLVRIWSRVIPSPLGYVLGAIGLVLITITGSLGGALAYGPDIDPFVSAVCKVLITK